MSRNSTTESPGTGRATRARARRAMRWALLLTATFAVGIFIGDFELGLLVVALTYLLERGTWNPPR